jgi:hypothetical protein
MIEANGGGYFHLHRIHTMSQNNSVQTSNTLNDYQLKLERINHALEGINHGISSAVETESGITPIQICCIIELVSDALSESIFELGELLQ